MRIRASTSNGSTRGSPISGLGKQSKGRTSLFSVRSGNAVLRMHNVLKALEAKEEESGLKLEDVDEIVLGILQSKHPLQGSNSLENVELGHTRYMLVLDPYSRVRVSYDVGSVFLLLVEFLSIPVILAWDIPLDGWLRWASLFGLLFWTVDIVLSFMTGFYARGELEMNPKRVARRYLRSWFIPDIAVVLIDACSVILAYTNPDSSSSGAALFRLSKFSRFLRLARLFRMVKVSEGLTRIAERNAASSLEVALEMMNPFWVILLVNHMMACAWYAVGKYSVSDTGATWLDDKLGGGSGKTYGGSSLLYQYTTAMHWAMTQMTPGSMQVFQQNTNERVYSFFCLLLGMVVFSSIISSLSAKLNQQQMKAKEKQQRLIDLRRFLRTKAVNARTAVAVIKHAEESMSLSRAKPRILKDVSGASLLSTSMRKRLHYELCAPHLRHPLFRWWSAFDLTGIQALCQDACEFVAHAPSDNLFFPRETAVGAYVHIKGILKYTDQQERASPVFSSSSPADEVAEGTLFCEMALWLHWVHVGELTAVSGSELILIRTEGLGKVLQIQRVVRHVVYEYGKAFHACLSDPKASMFDDPTNDISSPLTTFDALLPMLPIECRTLFGVIALTKARKDKGQFAKTADDLLLIEEIQQGKMNLMINQHGETWRMVSLVVISLHREERKVLVELGELSEDGALNAEPKLPGKKQRDQESASACLARITAGTLCTIRNGFVITKTTSHESSQFSKRSSFPTRYLRTINHAELVSPSPELGLQDARMPSHINIRTGISTMSVRTSRSDSSTRSGSRNLASGSADQGAFASDAFVMADGEGGFFLYSWMDLDELEHFKTPVGKEFLQRSFKGGSSNADMFERAVQRHTAASENPNEVPVCVVCVGADEQEDQPEVHIGPSGSSSSDEGGVCR
mmetsp:Transcript_68594/g.222301  ORF Transcript_68594/g.222301 Transcript_68594/m.222301 type:complete len:913 (-) Transcript_68594:215-2953(-)